MSSPDGTQQVLAGIGVSPGRASGVVVVMPDAVPEPPAGSTLGADDDADRFAGISLNSGLERALDGRLVAWGLEDDVATGDIAADPREARRFADRHEIGHRQFAGAADVHGSEQCYPDRHCAVAQPVDPKPPLPRTVSSRLSTSFQTP